MAKRLTHEEFKTKLEKENPTIELLSEYNGNKNYITVRCKIDGNIWKTKPNWLKRGNRCLVCYHKFSANIRKYTLDEFITKAIEVHGDEYDYSKVEYINNKTKVCIICPEHGEFWQRPDKHLTGHGCKICNYSSLERTVEIFLKANNIVFEAQKRFEWLGLQSLDFYLPEYNIAIECQGEQHFNGWWKTGDRCNKEKIINNDIKKHDLCLEHNINIIYYFDVSFKENDIVLYNENNTANDLQKLIQYIKKQVI